VTRSPRRGATQSLDRSEVALSGRYRLRVQVLVGLDPRGGPPPGDHLASGRFDPQLGRVRQGRGQLGRELRALGRREVPGLGEHLFGRRCHGVSPLWVAGQRGEHSRGG
jgi:hypothetical protein